MKPRLLACTVLVLFLILAPSSLRSQTPASDANLTVHEWGTFTSIAGKDGRAVVWQPLSGSTDLPGFVEHFKSANFKVSVPGTVRMETPVLYFYAPHETTVSVRVSLSKGLITEWYPHATSVSPEGPLTDVALYKEGVDGSIAWNNVLLEPGGDSAKFPRDEEGRTDRYYAARQTSSTPLLVRTHKGDQFEKFLFYRGVASFAVPVSAKIEADGKVVAENLFHQEIPNVLLFERRGDKLGYRIADASAGKPTLDPPELTGSMSSLNQDVVSMLIAQGLYQDEAQAMFETWQDSWFEEGSRLLYIVPRQFVDDVLPLTIHPIPAQTVRVFVGRIELITPATQSAVEQALLARDYATLDRYGRFFNPILDALIASEKDPARKRQLLRALSTPTGTPLAANTRR